MQPDVFCPIIFCTCTQTAKDGATTAARISSSAVFINTKPATQKNTSWVRSSSDSVARATLSHSPPACPCTRWYRETGTGAHGGSASYRESGAFGGAVTSSSWRGGANRRNFGWTSDLNEPRGGRHGARTTTDTQTKHLRGFFLLHTWFVAALSALTVCVCWWSTGGFSPPSDTVDVNKGERASTSATSTPLTLLKTNTSATLWMVYSLSFRFSL